MRTLLRPLCRVSAACVAVLLAGASMAAAQSFTLDREVSNRVALSRPANGLVPLLLVYKGAKAGEAPPPNTHVHVSAPALISDGNTAGPANADLATIGPGNCDAQPRHREFITEVKNRVENLCLYLKPMAPGKYLGDLVITADGMDAAVKQFEITQPSPLSLTPTSIIVSQPGPISIMLPLWGSPSFWASPSGQAEFSATLQEKGGKADVEGVTARLEVISNSSAFDPSHVTAKWNSAPADTDLFVTDPSRKIPAGQQAKVHFTLTGLKAGNYNLVFRFSGANATNDDTQKLTAVVNVRRHWVWPALLILAATLLSFLANKVVAAKRRRFTLMEKIKTLRPAWLDEFAETQPVVWVRAMLNQAEALSSRYWLRSPDSIESRVNEVGNVLKVLDEARRLRDRLQDALDPLVFRRVVQSLERLVRRVGAGAIDDQMVTKFETQLSSFENWLSKDRYAATLWAEIEPGMRRLQAAIAAGPVPPALRALPTFVKASDALDAALTTPPTSATAVDAAYITFMTLSILWQCRDHNAALTACENAAGDLMKLFEIADGRDWQILTTANLTIQLPPIDDPHGLEAYDPLAFSITAGGAAVERSYLFHHKILCTWNFTFTPRRGLFRGRTKTMRLTPKTVGPSVVQYFPLGGTVQVWADLSFQGDSHSVPSKETLEIVDSREFRITKGFAQAEVLSWILAVVIAVASGFSIYYAGNASWGSLKDYLTLFLWGAGADTGRNFLQSAAGQAK